ncbi:MAG: helix-hairpin-helix domain-containing protein [Deltaproteobacteria bacterium]|nr:MAG: helix-hairpin-helix domain-containing protein [Deltaproteobacteria bacterium]
MQHVQRILKALCLSSLLVGAVAAPCGDAHAATGPTVLALAGPVALEGVVNLNTATVDQLDMLPGIGPATAERIVAYRKRHPFKKAIHVMRVKGIGRKKYERIKPYIAVQGETTLRVASVGGHGAVSDPAH